MDELAHALWGYGILNKSKNPWLVVLFAVLPDIIIFVPFMIYAIITKGLQFGHPELMGIPGVVFFGYNLTHSLVVVAGVFLIIYFIKKEIYMFLYAWPIHIILDIPTHTGEFFPTLFLYPLSDFYINGINWGTKWFMSLNYSLLVLLFVFILIKRKKNNKKKGQNL